MRRSLIYLVAFMFLCLTGSTAYASHNRAGDIGYRWLYGSTYEITITTYTFHSTSQPVPADRCDLDIFWGDGDSSTLLRYNGDTTSVCSNDAGEGVLVAGNIRKNEYLGIHTYPGPGIYRITMYDPNRNAEVNNMLNSFETPFFIYLTFYIGTSSSGLDTNSSPLILNPPIDDACSGKLFVHNPGAFDLNGDSISYELGDCFEEEDENGVLVPALGYVIPGNISINPVTGDLIWDTPPQITHTQRGYDEFNVCFEIIEWRNGVTIGRIQRDMQITVWACDNEPPILAASDTCVLAGDTILINVKASDPDNSNLLLALTASGGPLILNNSPATFTTDPNPPNFKANGIFRWETNCSHVRKQPYSVSFKVEDNDWEVSLVDFETISINVIGPAPTGLQSTPTGNHIELSWDASVCSEVIGYKVYRRNGSYTGTIDCPCESGVPTSAGYDLVATVDGLNTVQYDDDDNGTGLIHGVDYCYRIVAFFPDGAESCPSEEACAQLTLDVPIITHVSVGSTDANSGRDTVIWSMPQLLDTAQYPGPYQYNIYQSPSLTSASVLIDSTASSTFLSLTDTIYIDNNLNTEITPNSYIIELWSGVDYVGATHIASSIFLTISPSDDQLDLTWEANVPWTNAEYFIYRLNDITLNYDLLDSTTTTTYSDTGLVNGVEYCYFIKSVGSYSISGIINPIINYSQKSCEIPVDLTAPCAPALTVTADCDQIQNELFWNNPNETCADDVMYYNVYSTPLLTEELTLLQTVSPATETSLLLNNLSSLAGCYAITAVDSANNESVLSDSICVDNCPVYALPNVFSPDGNMLNDLFIPYPYKFVDKIDMKIYDRWGQLVFETTDPNINWDGKYYKNNEDVSEGVFFYVVEVDMIRLSGIETTTLTGFIHLLRNINPGNTN